MGKKVEIFDPALCCPTGVCGPSVDPELTRISRMVMKLESEGYDIVRYNLAQEPDPFVSQKEVNALLEKKGPDALPATVVDGVLVKEGSYPTKEEFVNWLGISEDLLAVHAPKKKLNFDIN
ncbi:arsenite efflux transporter metallochaperone ArsD [Bacillus shivajii]|nr:arsenite efflux transporter metallochaperone ArsD [Bacillus shivajii]